MIRIGVIGLGFGERVHVPALRRTGRFEVAAIACRTPHKAREAADRLGIARAHERWADLVRDPSLQAVSIAIPPGEQAKIALAAVRRGKALLLEKPLALTLPQAVKIQRSAAAAGVAAMVDFELCEIEEWRMAKRWLSEGRIGRLRQVVSNWHLETYAARHRIDTWKLRAADGGGALYQFAPHVFHYLEWFGGPLAALSASLGASAPDAQDSCVRVAADYVSGATASVSLLTDAPGGSGHRVELYGTEGAMILDNTTPDPIRGFTLRVSRAGDPPSEHGPSIEPGDEASQDGRIDAVSKLAERLAVWVETGRPAAPSLADGVRVQRLIECVKRSSRTRRQVSCAEAGRPGG